MAVNGPIGLVIELSDVSQTKDHSGFAKSSNVPIGGRWRRLCFLLIGVAAIAIALLVHLGVERPISYSDVSPRFGTLLFHSFLKLKEGQCPHKAEGLEVDMSEYRDDAAYRDFCDAVARRIRPILRADRQYYVWSIGKPLAARGWPFLSHDYEFRVSVAEWPTGKETAARHMYFDIPSNGTSALRPFGLLANVVVYFVVLSVCCIVAKGALQRSRMSRNWSENVGQESEKVSGSE